MTRSLRTAAHCTTIVEVDFSRVEEARNVLSQDGEMIEVDCRPSDAIALAVTASVPIYVAEDVLDEVCGE